MHNYSVKDKIRRTRTLARIVVRHKHYIHNVQQLFTLVSYVSYHHFGDVIKNMIFSHLSNYKSLPDCHHDKFVKNSKGHITSKSHVIKHMHLYPHRKETCTYRSVLAKCPWALYHNSLFFTTLGACLPGVATGRLPGAKLRTKSLGGANAQSRS